jgi:hypothetical protein
MSTPEKRYSQSDLEKLYREHEFDKILPLCTRELICDEEYSPQSVPPRKFAKRRGYRYLDANSSGDEVAVVFHYTLVDGTQTRVINRIVINGKPHDALLP